MKSETRPIALKRLSRIEGQVRGVARMIESDRYCIDVVRHIQAIKAALGSLEKLTLNDHLETCVDHALKSKNLEDRREKVQELVSVFSGKKS